MWSTANKLMILLTAIIVVVQMTWWYPQLPNPMPSHFDNQGQINGTMDKTLFCGMMGGLNALFLIGFPLLSVLMKQLPNSMVNIPNKEFWLATERRDQSLQRVGTFLSFLGWSSGWFFMGLFQLTALVAVNARQTITPEFFWLLGIFMAVIWGTVLLLIFKFRLPRSPKRNHI